MHGFRMPAHAAVSPSVSNLPARSNVVIRNAYVMSMEPGQPDLSNGDVHVDNGLIVDVGTGLAAPGAQIIDGRGFIVMPGLIDTHWHMWTTLLRNMSGDDRAHGYFPMTTALGKVYPCSVGELAEDGIYRKLPYSTRKLHFVAISGPVRRTRGHTVLGLFRNVGTSLSGAGTSPAIS